MSVCQPYMEWSGYHEVLRFSFITILVTVAGHHEIMCVVTWYCQCNDVETTQFRIPLLAKKIAFTLLMLLFLG